MPKATKRFLSNDINGLQYIFIIFVALAYGLHYIHGSWQLCQATNKKEGGQMAEQNGKKEINYHAPVREFDNTKNLVTGIGFAKGSLDKYQIVWLIPTTDEEAQTRYGCDLKELVAAGIRKLSTMPDYPTVGFNEDGTLKDGGHKAMQTLADGYKPGRKASADPSAKITAAKVKSAEKDLGMDFATMVAKMKELKELGMLE